MGKSTSYPHQDLITKNAIDVTTLPAKTQSLITKFASETDEEKKETMDESIYGQIEDHFQKLKKAEEEAAAKAKTATPAAGTKKVDVSTAASTKSPEQEAAEKAAADASAPKKGGLMSKIYPGRK
ncbi:MAG TPA: hypothetical protein PK289_09475 [Bacteroidia bacterium]|nr:hypothetical protein [Bacteroidia bacterium]